MEYRKMPYFDLTIQKFSGDTIDVEVHPGNTIVEVKVKIQEKEGIHAFQQSFIFEGNILEDSKMLGDYNIQKESIVSLVLHPEKISSSFTWKREDQSERFTDEEWLLHGIRIKEVILPEIVIALLSDDSFSDATYDSDNDEEDDPWTYAMFIEFYDVQSSMTDITITFTMYRSMAPDVSDRVWNELSQLLDESYVFDDLDPKDINFR